MINEFLDNITGRVRDAFSGLSDFVFLAGWYALGLGLLFAALALSWFFGGLPIIGKWIRGIGGVVVLLFGAFLAGLQVMANHAKADNQRYRDKIKELQQAQRRDKPGGNWFS
jgi:fatty acid desaturase